MKALLKAGRYLLAGYGAYVAGKKVIEWLTTESETESEDANDNLKDILEHDLIVMGRDEQATLAFKGTCDAVIEKTGKLYISDMIKAGYNTGLSGIFKDSEMVSVENFRELFTYETMNRYGWTKDNWNPTLEVANDKNDIPRIVFNFGKITKLEDLGHGGE